MINRTSGLHAGMDAAQHLLRHLDLDTQRIEIDQTSHRLAGGDEFTRLDIEIIKPPVETGPDRGMTLGRGGPKPAPRRQRRAQCVH